MRKIILMTIFINLIFIKPVSAQLYDLQEDLFYSDVAVKGIYDIKHSTGLGDLDPRQTIANVINIILGFLGIIALILVLSGGFMWMTSGGNSDKTAQAKSVMGAGIIGLVIILSAFGIAQFIVNSLVAATT